MRAILLIIIVVQLVLFNACKDEDPIIEVDRTLIFDSHNIDTLLCETVKQVDFLILDISQNSDVFEVNKMIVKNDLIFIGDFHAGKIVVYDITGKLKFVIDKKGVGPQEYLELRSFTVDEQNIYTLDNYRHCMNIFDCYTGEFKGVKKLPFVVWDMEVLPDNHFIFAFVPLLGGKLNIEQPLFKIFVTDKDLQIVNKFFKYKENDYEFIGKHTYFSPIGDGVVFSSMGSDDFSFFYGADSIRRIAIDFENKIPDKYRTNLKEIEEAGYSYIAQTPMCCINYVAFEFRIGDNLISYVYAEDKESFLANPDINSFNYFLYPNASFRNKFFCYFDDYSLYKELVDTGFERANPVVEHHLLNEGAILLIYTMN